MSYVRIKICGITNIEDAQLATSLGADALGFIFCKSSRQVTIPQAKDILDKLPPFVNKVAVICNFEESQIREILSSLPIDTLQFHGDEPEDFCLKFKPYNILKVISISSDESIEILKNYSKLNTFLLDTSSKEGGGSGKTFNWDIIKKIKSNINIILAGGLNPLNILSAIQTTNPYGVDVASGVEKSPGIKDHKKLTDFIQLIRKGE